MEHDFAGRTFEFVGEIDPERDPYGEVLGEFPQSRYRNERNLPLHRYGHGPFCRFRVARGWRREGIYILTSGDEPLYVGECVDLETRWGPVGYGLISPRNCYKGGQQTNCRINNLIFVDAKTGVSLNLWFYPTESNKQPG